MAQILLLSSLVKTNRGIKGGIMSQTSSLSTHPVSTTDNQVYQNLIDNSFVKGLVQILTQGIQKNSSGSETVEEIKDYFSGYGLVLSDLQTKQMLKMLFPKKNQSTAANQKKLRPADPKGILNSKHIHPDFKNKIASLLDKAYVEGLEVMIFEGHRSFERQNKLYKTRTADGGRVTYARGGESFHNYGLAVDIVFYDAKGNPSWSNDHPWDELGKIGKKLGLNWGGDFKKINDRSHFEYHPGVGLTDIKQAYSEGGIKNAWKILNQY